MEELAFKWDMEKTTHTNIAGYARLQTDLDGKVMNIIELNGSSEDDEAYISDYSDEIMDAVFAEKDSDLLVAIEIVSEDNSGYGYIEHDSWCNYPNVIVLQRNCKKILENKIRKYDKIIYESGDMTRRFISRDRDEEMYYFHGLPDDALQLLELRDMYFEAYGELIKLMSYPTGGENYDS